jgi:membrane protease YdiL (CAAX protease family)
MNTDRLGELIRGFGILSVYLIIFSAMAGYYVCFWPGKHPVRRIIWLVCAPALIGLGLLFSRVVYLSGPASSILESGGSALGHKLAWAKSTLWMLPSGFQFTALGLLLIVVFASRLTFGISTLPLALPTKHACESEDFEAWQRLQFLVFVLVGPLFLVGIVLSFMGLWIPMMLFSRPPAYIQSVWFGRLTPVIESLVAYGVLVCFLWREEKQTIRQSIRWPAAKNLLLAGAFAIGIDVTISIAQYLPERAQWAAHNFGGFGPPMFEAYFGFPDPWLFLLLFGALCEEIVFRGLLQARFIQRYGLYRGMFLVGITWAAYHFFADFSFVHPTVVEVFEKLGFRIFMSVVLSFVLGWLTLRAGSVLPAAIAHGFYNVLTKSSLGPPFPSEGLVRVGLWAVLAYILFRYWPFPELDSPEPAAELPSLESAV